MLNRLLFWRKNQPAKIPKWLWLAIILTSLTLIAGTFWKYHLFAYNALDLAIFNQVFWKTAHGDLFGMTIHPHSYLGDHAGLIILALTPIYWIWNDPRMLLILQSVALLLPASLIWLIVQARGKNLGVGRDWIRLSSVLLAVAWLASPAIHNAGFFEFHLLPFALIPLLGTCLAYEQDDRWSFVAWSILAFACREDVALVILMFSFLAWSENRKLWWRLFPFLSGLVWFIGAGALIRVFNPNGGYKFMVYYEWLGHNPIVAATNIFIHPLRTLAHITTLGNLEMAIALLMPLAFLPLLKPRRLMLAFLPLLQIILGAPGGGQNVTEMHYVVLFLPAIFLAATDGILTTPKQEWFDRLPLRREDTRKGLMVLVTVCVTYGFFTLGPWPKTIASLFDAKAKNRAALARETIKNIPADASVGASYSLLTNLSGRASVYSLHYIFLGVTQFAVDKYPVPSNLEYLALENDDLINYRSQFLNTAWAKPFYGDGRTHLLTTIGDTVWTNGDFNVYRKRSGLPNAWSSGIEEEVPMLTRQKMNLTNNSLMLVTDWNKIKNADDLVIDVRVQDKSDALIINKEFPLLGLPPQTTETPEGICNTLRIYMPNGTDQVGHVTVSLKRQDTVMVLDGWRSTTRYVNEEETILSQEIQ